MGTVSNGKIWEFCHKYSKFWKNFLDISEWVSKKATDFWRKKSLSKFKPNCAISCHNMGTICKKNQLTGLTIIAPLLLSLGILPFERALCRVWSGELLVNLIITLPYNLHCHILGCTLVPDTDWTDSCGLHLTFSSRESKWLFLDDHKCRI